MARSVAFNSATPPGWSAERVKSNIQTNEIDVLVNAPLKKATKDLSAKIRSTGQWSVRNPHRRGTCNAFASVAAEELFWFEAVDAIEPVAMSEEFLHAKSRAAAPPTTVTQEDRERIKNSGGTFLTQVKHALSENGMATAQEVPYLTYARPDYEEKNISQEILLAAKDRVNKTRLIQDMTSATVGANRIWPNLKRGLSIAEIFADRLLQGFPVVASFAILHRGEYVWNGQLALARGEIRYPEEGLKGDIPAIAGHTVCLLKYIPDLDNTDSKHDWFLFRNSHGPLLFGRDVDKYPDQPNAGLPGYGFISAYDVDRYCWDFLSRGTEVDRQALFQRPVDIR